MQNHTINALSEATGLDRRTIKRKLGAAGLLAGRDEWALPEALPVLFEAKEPDGYAANRNRLVIAQAKRVEIENAEKERNLMPVALVEKLLARIYIAFRQQVLAADIPKTLATELLETLSEMNLDSCFEEAIKEIESEETKEIPENEKC